MNTLLEREGALATRHALAARSLSARGQLALVHGEAGIGKSSLLEHAGIVPDLVVGCSAGAVFGTLVATGQPAPRPPIAWPWPSGCGRAKSPANADHVPCSTWRWGRCCPRTGRVSPPSLRCVTAS